MNTNVFSPEVIRSCILEGVENLRVRKCRPDRETIAHYVLRKCIGTIGATPERTNEIFNELEHIVDDGLLLKVEYKASISYRTPESFDEKNSPLLTKHSKILNSRRTTLQILTTINDLIAANPDYCVSGIPWTELQEHLEKLDSTRFSADKVDALVNREVSVGKVLVGDGKRVYPKDIKPPKSAMAGEENKDSESKSNGAGENANVPKKRGRKPNAMKLVKDEKEVKVKPVKSQNSPVQKKVGRSNAAIAEKVAEAVKKTFDGRVSGRNKIKRKVFDPSDVPPPAKVQPKKKRRSSSANNAETCGICTRKMTAKTLIICSSCASAYHISCLNLSKDALAAAKSQDWLCSDCRICGECSGPLKSSNYVECVKCKVGVHSVCAGIDKDYLCAECKPEVKSDMSANNEEDDPDLNTPPPPKRKGVGRPPKTYKKSRKLDPENVEDEVESMEDLENSEDVVSDSGSASPSSKVKKSPRTVSVEDGNSDSSSTPANVKASSSVDNTSTPNLVDGLGCNKWTPAEVEKFFIEKGLPEAGALFREQEVDGLSLLLMKRSDVIFGLRLRLGPALKVYKLILQLQNNVVKT